MAAILQPTAEIPETMLGECPDLSTIPHRDLRETEIAKLWGQDRANFGQCRADKRALNKAVRVQQRPLPNER